MAKLLQSVLCTVRPLLASATSSSVASLTPASEHSTALLLELALLVGITVSLCRASMYMSILTHPLTAFSAGGPSARC